MSAYGQSRQLSRRLSEATKIPLCLCFRLCRHPDPGKPVLLLEDIWWCGWRQGSARRNRHFPTSFPKPSFFTAARYKVPCFQIILLDFCTTLVPPYSSISFCGSISVVQQVFFFLRLTSCFFLQCWKSFIWLCWNSPILWALAILPWLWEELGFPKFILQWWSWANVVGWGKILSSFTLFLTIFSSCHL